MSAQVLDAEQEIVTIEVAGKLTPEELAVVHAETAIWLSRWGGGCLLILANEFNGWDVGQSWENLSFQTRNDTLIRKMALVAAQRWESLALLFTAKGHRPFPIECFTSQIAARAWLCDGADTQTCFRFILPLHETPPVPRLLPVIRAVCQRILRNTRSPCQRGFDVSSEEFWQEVAGLACRTIAIDYRQQGCVYDTQTSGPNIGLVVTF